MRKIYVFFMVVLFLASMIAGTGIVSSEDDNQSKSRKETKYVTKFTGDIEGSDLVFGSGGGTNTELNITLPKRATVIDAELDIEGKGGSEKKLYNYNDTTNNKAWSGNTLNKPPTSQPSAYEDREFSNTDYNNINSHDGSRADHSASFNSTSRLYHLFRFKITEANPIKFNFNWIGRSYRVNAIGVWINEAYIFAYCYSNSTWVKIDSIVYGVTQQIKTMVVDKDINDPGKYIHSDNSTAYFMVMGPTINPMTMDTGSIGTDFVQLTGFGTGLNYPADVSLDVGADGDNEWSHSGTFNGLVTLKSASGLKTELQEHIDAAGTDEGFLTVDLKLSSGATGVLWVGNLNITIEALEHNEPPVIVPDILDHFYMTEDDAASGDNLVDLHGSFSDDHDTSDTLRYSIVDSGSAETLEAALDSDGHHIDFTPAEDFFGTVMFRVKAVDSGRDETADTFDDLIALSHYFNVTVEPVNDAPLMEVQNTHLTVNEGSTLKFNANVTDIDDTDFQWETNNTEKVNIMMIGSATFKVEVIVVPAESDVTKSLYFDLTVWDNGGKQGQNFIASSKVEFTVDVLNVNDPPKFKELTVYPDEYTEPMISGITTELKNDYAALEDVYYNLTVTALDPDIGIDDEEQLTYELLDTDDIIGEISINPDTGAISLLAVNEDVGIIKFTVKVSDFKGESDEHDIQVTVKNRNDAPFNAKIVLPLERTFTTKDKITFKGEVEDEDLDVPNSDEELYYMWFTNHSAAPLGVDYELYYLQLEAGWHEITFLVTDAKGAEASDSIVIEIQGIDDGPPPDPNDGKDDDKDDDPSDKDDIIPGSTTDDKAFNTVFLALLAIIIVVVVLIAIFFGVLRPKQKKAEDLEKEKAAAELPPLAMPMPGQFGMQPMQQPQQPYPGMVYQQPYGTVPQPQQQYPQAQPVQVQTQELEAAQPEAAEAPQALPEAQDETQAKEISDDDN